MEKGIIRWFDNKKGYGFIEMDKDGTDLFVHYSAIAMEGYKTLKAKEEVEFEVVDGEKGPQAADVKRSGTAVAEADEEEETEEVEEDTVEEAE